MLGKAKRAYPGWLFLLLLLFFFPVAIVADFLFIGGMGLGPLSASVFLAALSAWILIEPSPPQIPSEGAQASPAGDEEVQRVKWNWHGRAKLAGLIGGILASVVGYIAATNAGLTVTDVERLGDSLERANYRVFLAFLIYAWLPYLALQLWSKLGNRK